MNDGTRALRSGTKLLSYHDCFAPMNGPINIVVYKAVQDQSVTITS